MEQKARHNINTKVIINFYECGKLMFGTVAATKFTNNGKVLYDIDLLPFKSEPDYKTHKITLKDIDSYFVEPIQEKHNLN